jgi:DNA-binding response OmpR family regulator
MIDIFNRHVTIGNAEVHLNPAEQIILYVLAANAGQVLSQDAIMDALGGADYGAGSNVVEQHVRNLRKKLGDDAHHHRYIVTVAGEGYMFISGGG